MNRNDRATTIQMAEKIVTALDSNHLKPHLVQSSHQRLTGKSGLSRHGSNSDALHADEFGRLREFLLNLQAELNRFASTLQQDIERLGLGVASAQFRYTGHKISVTIFFDHETKGACLGLHGFGVLSFWEKLQIRRLTR